MYHRVTAAILPLSFVRRAPAVGPWKLRVPAARAVSETFSLAQARGRSAVNPHEPRLWSIPKKSMLRFYLFRRSYTQGMVDPRWYYCPLLRKLTPSFVRLTIVNALPWLFATITYKQLLRRIRTSRPFDWCIQRMCSATSWKVIPSVVVLKPPIHCQNWPLLTLSAPLRPSIYKEVP